MDWLSVLLTAIPAAALLGGLVAFFGHLISRSNAKLSAQISKDNTKLSVSLEAAKTLAGSRQKWIDELREEMVQFLKLCTADRDDRDFDSMIESAARIQLRMNPNDPDYAALQNAMSACIRMDSDEAGDPVAERFMKVCQNILKREWEVVKAELKTIDRILTAAS